MLKNNAMSKKMCALLIFSRDTFKYDSYFKFIQYSHKKNCVVVCITHYQFIHCGVDTFY